MNTRIKTAIAAGIVAAYAFGATPALARGMDWGCPGMHDGRSGMQRMEPGQFKARAETRLARLELALAIKPEQKAAWDQFKADMLAQAGKVEEQMLARSKEAVPQTAVERLARGEEFSKAHLAHLTDVRRAVETLYDKLGDAQKKVFDAEFRQGPWGGPARGDAKGTGRMMERGPGAGGAMR